MLRFVVRRLIVLIPIVLGVSALSFLLLYLIPGDVVALVIGVPLGLLAAVKRGSLGSTALGGLVLVGLSVPNFWLGILLILFASLYLHWFPPQGLLLVWQQPLEAVKQLAFPSLALG